MADVVRGDRRSTAPVTGAVIDVDGRFTLGIADLEDTLAGGHDRPDATLRLARVRVRPPARHGV